ncbi:MAG: hypothetical protein ACXVIY_00795 [Mucilaginibacter sp.]
MKKIIFIALLFIAFKASAQNPGTISGQFADKYVGQTMSVFGYVYKISYDKPTRTMFAEFGSKSLAKGVILRLTSDEKLQANNINFQDLRGHFITVTGKIIKNAKGEICIDGDDRKTSVIVQQSYAIN